MVNAAVLMHAVRMGLTPGQQGLEASLPTTKLLYLETPLGVQE